MHSPNHDSREGQAVDMLVLHYTGMQSGQAAYERLCDPEAKVSAHYLVHEDGRVDQLVDENMRAWHAGVAHWRGDTNINARSVGIEIVNPGHEFGYVPFPQAQMQAVLAVSKSVLSRHEIPARNVVGHSDVAPARKQDPGELFDWPWLAEHGVGLWHREAVRHEEGRSVDRPSQEPARAAERSVSVEHISQATGIDALDSRFGLRRPLVRGNDKGKQARSVDRASHEPAGAVSEVFLVKNTEPSPTSGGHISQATSPDDRDHRVKPEDDRLRCFGYDTTDLSAAITAFQRHFRRDALTGEWDAQCEAILDDLLAQV